MSYSCRPPTGFCYVVFESARSVAALVQCALWPDESGELYVKVASRQKPCGKDTQVIAWLVADAHWTRDAYAESLHSTAVYSTVHWTRTLTSRSHSDTPIHVHNMHCTVQ